MIGFVTDWGQAVFSMFVEAGPFLLLGLAIAGLIQVLVPAERVLRHLGGDDLRSVLIATLIGAPLPLCSCSVIPTAVELRRKGASKGATTAFLISTPEDGVDAIGITWALLDPIMTITRPIAALLTAFGAGALVNVFVRKGWMSRADGDTPRAPVLAAAGHAHGDDHDHHAGHSHEAAVAPAAPGTPAACCADEPSRTDPAPRRSWLAVIREAVGYGFGPLLADLTPWLVIGFLLSGLIGVLVPEGFFGEVVPAGMAAMALMLLFSVPMYICATASTPIAAALIAKGLDPGAALVFMLAGPSTNIATILFVWHWLGKSALAIYLGTIVVFAIGFGILVDWIYAVADIDLTRIVAANTDMAMGIGSYAGAAVLLFLLLVHAWRLSLVARFEGWLTSIGLVPRPQVARVVIVLVAIGAWLTTAYSVAMPGETGFVTRFGRVVATVEGPAATWHLPAPFASFEIASTAELRRVGVGAPETADEALRLSATGDAESTTDDIECVTGDEKLLLVTYSVHYRARDAYAWRFAIGDVPALVKACSEAALRRMVGKRSMDEHLIERREPLEREIASYLQENLDRTQAGVEIVAVNLEYVHAPPQVHFVYRDVASALEDKETAVKNGIAYESERLAQARADAERIVQDALGAKAKTVAQAEGAVAAFLALARLHVGERGAALEQQLVTDAMKRAFAKRTIVAKGAKNVSITETTSAGAGGEGGSISSRTPKEEDG